MKNTRNILAAVCVATALAQLTHEPTSAAGLTNNERWFEEVTHAAGILAKHTNRTFGNEYAQVLRSYTAIGAAAAVADFDRDGFDDVFVTDSKEQGRNHLYRNNGNFTFTDIAEAAGVANGNDRDNASADAVWFDYDNDRLPDLFVARFGHNQLFHNLGNGKFREVTREAGLYGSYRNTVTTVAVDYDKDGFLDLLIGSNFPPVDLFHPGTPRFFPENLETANNGGGLVLYRNNHDGTFSDVTERAGLTMHGWVLDIGHADADNDGDDDLYVACDFGQDRFFVNQGDGTFRDATARAIGSETKHGMNVDWGDFDGDGFLDVYVTNITDEYMREGNFLWQNNHDLTFTDVSRETGTYDTGWGWAAKFFDYDNDGWLDLYVVNGWISAGEESYLPDVFEMLVRPNVDFSDVRNWPPMGNKSMSGFQKKRLFHNQGNQTFTEQAARHGLDSTRDGRGIALADFDNDGDLDLFVTNVNAEPQLYRNTLPAGHHWIEFVLEGTKSNRSGVGAQVRLVSGGRTQLSFVNGGNGFDSQSTTRVHFGLGERQQADRVEIRWPSGTTQLLKPLAADRIYAVTEGAAEAVPFTVKKDSK